VWLTNSGIISETKRGNEMEQQLGKDVVAKLEGGELVVSGLNGAIELKVKAKQLLQPKLDEIKADIATGKIDPIKGTNLDQSAMLAVLAYIEEKLLG
jgi:hypothetical protein